MEKVAAVMLNVRLSVAQISLLAFEIFQSINLNAIKENEQFTVQITERRQAND